VDSKEKSRNKKGGTKLWLHHQETQVTCGITHCQAYSYYALMVHFHHREDLVQ